MDPASESRFFVQFTGPPAGAEHPWKEVIPVDGGASWRDGPRSGTAREVNGSDADLAGVRAALGAGPGGRGYRFAYPTCR
jgi:hypothetical protein